MKVNVQTLDQVRKKIEVEISGEKLNEIRETIFREVTRQAKIKGFRPGKAPRPIIASYYKDYIEEEVKRRMIEETMSEALKTADVNPLGEPVADFIYEEGKNGYTLEVEVLPDIELPNYSGVEVEVDPVTVTEDEIKQRIEGMREMHAQMVPREDGSTATENDLVFVKYVAYENGEPLNEVKADNYPVQLGAKAIMPELEEALVGMKAGEEKDVPLTFPEDYPDKSFANKTLTFHVTVNEIKEKKFPEINDEFAKDVGFDDLASLDSGVRKELENEKENIQKRTIADKIVEGLLSGMDIPVPKRFLEQRVEANLEEMRGRFDAGKMTAEERNVIETGLRQEYEKREEQNMKVEMVLIKIAQKEGIKVEESDIEERIKKIAESAKRPYEEAKRFYEQNNFMDGLRSTVLREKTVDFLRSQAIVKEKA